ncbi:carbohydrate ABC transporter permease [Brachybacterium alimentarium]|uniref:Glycerol-3-phosphate ABC transporter permease n=1 Tax=Brachybacterium alimentarium TaxID=47845 RepID=A0A2A3YNQ5_9MICO|nr:carbohydrate ABC transporter permease [Brachybacterium alimentarium]PCC40735.1 glycerol-3-phosphate ABC transporter permease [Brachybacterium alimentarium]
MASPLITRSSTPGGSSGEPPTDGGPGGGVTRRGTRRRPSTLKHTWWGYLLLLAVGLVFLIPLYMLLSTSFKTNGDIYSWPMKWLPSELTVDNMREAWRIAPFGAFIKNSLIVTVVGATLKVLLAIFAAYAFAFLPFPGKKWLFVIMLGALMVPGHVTLLVNYITMGNLGLINTYAGLILPGVASAFGTFLLRQHFMSLPAEVFEAAEVDGCGHLRRLLSFTLPMSIPAVATVALVAVIDEWNNFVWPLIITNSVNMRTLPIGLMYLKSNDGLTNWGVLMSGTLIVVLPMLLVFLCAQRYIVSGLTGAAAGNGR